MSNTAVINFLFNSQGAINELENFKSRFGSAIDSIQNSAIVKFGALGATLAGIFSVKDLVEHTELIGELNTKYHDLIDTTKASKFSNLIELLGGTDTEAVQAMDKLQGVVQDLNQGKAPDFIKMLGLQARDANGKLKDSVTFAKELREAMKPYSNAQQTKWLEELGVYSPAMKRFMSMTDDELAEYTAKAEKMGVVSEESYQRVLKFREAIARLRGAFRRLGETILKLGLGTLIDKITDSMEKFLDLDEESQEKIMAMAAAFTVLFLAVKPATNIIKLVASAVKLIAALSPAVIAAAAIVGLIAAVTFNIGGFNDKLESYLASYNKWVEEISKEHPNAGRFLKQLAELAQDVLHPIEALKKAYNGLAEVFGWKKMNLDVEQKTSVTSGGTSGVLASAVAGNNEDNRSYTINLNPVINGVSEENSSGMIENMKNWAQNSITNILKNTAGGVQ